MEKKEEEGITKCQAIDELIEDGRLEGEIEGKAEGRAFLILDLLEELGAVKPEISEKITRETDDGTLRRWLKLAARAESMEAFEKEMEL